jgi:[methyl-Co(III) methanol-specific corrinoid protein]:coenzyme M methyltransferase
MADVFSPKERLLRSLKKDGVDRPPVICPGGMMNAAVVEVMKKTGNRLPEAHHSGDLMASLALDVEEETGFENFGVPFCMTIEPEALGSAVDYGSLECEPKIKKEAFLSVKDAALPSPGSGSGLGLGSIAKNPRAGAVLDTLSTLSKKYPDIPAIGSIAGPMSTAGSLVDPMTFFKELRRDRDGAHRLISTVTDELIKWAALMAENGASVITIADPTATGEILGPKLFEEYALYYINKMVDAIHELGLPVIVHICGDVRVVKQHLYNLHGDALSVDAMVNLSALKEENTGLTTMGNLSTYLLDTGSANTIRSGAETLLKRKIDIIAPACGLSTSTPLENLKAFTDTIKG